MWGATGISLGNVIAGLVNHRQHSRIEETRYRDDDDGATEAEGGTAVVNFGSPTSSIMLSSHLSRYILFGSLLAIALDPTAVSSPSQSLHAHPSPTSPSYTYPPLKVACVVPPSLLEDQGRHKRKQKDRDSTDIQDWIRETQIVASRGAKIINWSEGAVKLQRGLGDGDGTKSGWEGMGRQERELLRMVAGVSDQYRVRHPCLSTAPLFNPWSLHSADRN